MPIPNNKFRKELFDSIKDIEPKFTASTQFINNCYNCRTMTVRPINISYASHSEVRCSLCNHVSYMNNFEFALSYLKQHVPDSPLIEEHYRNMQSNEVTNTVPILQFVKNYVEFQKTLLGE
jgi:hypothetical protein